MLENEIKNISKLGIEYIILFGIPHGDEKDTCRSEAYNDNGIIQRAVIRIKEINLDINVITDVCMCEYTNHGQCGILNENRYVNNDITLEYLAKIAISYDKAVADMIAPYDMIDGRISSLREVLDEFGASFRDIKVYQMYHANSNEDLIESELDVLEGAGIIITHFAKYLADTINK